ncbi:hypothetical protein JZ751_022084 [Albula glossodonta]|uniref:Uncharacterized protein n=1 Tax=Albula glossodonta TaxID=121402 RepID=A0A8T2MU84_9TELE|nr:hypothetical protein JZ751_022084 [Albula glossodonta]
MTITQAQARTRLRLLLMLCLHSFGLSSVCINSASILTRSEDQWFVLTQPQFVHGISLSHAFSVSASATVPLATAQELEQLPSVEIQGTAASLITSHPSQKRQEV